MPIVRWAPQRSNLDMVSMQEEMNRIFDSVFNARPASRLLDNMPFTPVVDIEETADEFVFRADLPGINQKDVKVQLMGETLTLRGERKAEVQERETNFVRCERAYGSFERSFTLPTPVRAENVRATYRDGVLEVHVPKAEEAKLREIEVKIG